jgi:hypothetical protein
MTSLHVETDPEWLEARLELVRAEKELTISACGHWCADVGSGTDPNSANRRS